MTAANWNKYLAVAGASLLATVAVVASGYAVSADPLTIERQINALMGVPDEADEHAPVDYGAGPGVKPKPEKPNSDVQTAAPALATTVSRAIPSGGAAAHLAGVFGPTVAWPLIPLHAVLLPDGRVMSYGTDQTGLQGAQFVYDVWDPGLGTDSNSHRALPNKTAADLFCSAQSVMLTGEVLTSGGDLTVNGVRNSAQNTTNIFSPAANTLTANTPMQYARWYGSLVSLPNGRLAIFGGRQNVGALHPAQPAITPEVYDPATRAWTALTGATSTGAFGGPNWYYPRAFVAPGGKIFVHNFNGTMYSVSTAGAGSVAKYAVTTSPGAISFPLVPFVPGKVLAILQNQETVVIDYSGAVPTVAATDSIDQVRYWASGTIMADGKVLITGGSTDPNKLTGVAYRAQIWNPATGHWTAGASATTPRLYHSNALLLPDATVMTGGGGTPGPIKELNAEIFYPPYLYASTGAPAVRPIITAATPQTLNPGDTISFTVGATDVISRVTFVRTGSATHSNNSDQVFTPLPFSQAGQNLTAVLPNDPTRLIPGYYMLFAFNAAGVPSVAKILKVM